MERNIFSKKIIMLILYIPNIVTTKYIVTLCVCSHDGTSSVVCSLAIKYPFREMLFK